MNHFAQQKFIKLNVSNMIDGLFLNLFHTCMDTKAPNWNADNSILREVTEIFSDCCTYLLFLRVKSYLRPCKNLQCKKFQPLPIFIFGII